MFKLVRIEVLGYKDYVYELMFECSDVKFVYDKFSLNARECLVSHVEGGYSIVVEVEYIKLFDIINILEDVNKRNVIVSLFFWVKGKVINGNGFGDCVSVFKYSDYEFLLGYYKSSIIDKFICKYTLTDKQVEYIANVLDDCDYVKYEEVLSDLITVFNFVEVESELFTKLNELGLKIDISSLDCNSRKLLLKVVSMRLFSNKFLYIIFSSCFNYEYLNFVFSLLIDNDIKVNCEVESFVVNLMYECFEISAKHSYTKFKKDLLRFVYED